MSADRVVPPAWPVAVSRAGRWLRQQSRRPGPIGDAAGLAVVLVNRSASRLSEVSAEMARATSAEVTAARHATSGKHRRSSGHKVSRPKSKSAKREGSAR
ncbi:MAG TPA: hypothetical protein VNH82_01130 [Candidatus Dormibacteraeota bacterium]|nr:hypothetical protein [Candidatus Dormibacteraeota bacterium]